MIKDHSISSVITLVWSPFLCFELVLFIYCSIGPGLIFTDPCDFIYGYNLQTFVKSHLILGSHHSLISLSCRAFYEQCKQTSKCSPSLLRSVKAVIGLLLTCSRHLTAARWTDGRMDGGSLPVWFETGFPSACHVCLTLSLLWPCGPQLDLLLLCLIWEHWQFMVDGSLRKNTKQMYYKKLTSCKWSLSFQRLNKLSQQHKP